MTGLLLCCAPLFVLTLRGWANAVLFLGGLMALLLLVRGDLPRARLGDADRRWVAALILAYIAPVLAVAIAAAIRHDGRPEQFDAPSRFLVAIPVFLFVLRSRWPVGRAMQAVLPVALVLVLGYLHVVGGDGKWRFEGGPERLTTFVVDPLVFGYFSLAFGLMCLVSIHPQDWRDGRRGGIGLRLVALALGLYLSVRSGSRSGWLALPLVAGLWGHLHWGRRHRLASGGVLLAVLVLPVAAYLLVPQVSYRVDEAIRDLREYPWNGVLQHQSSLGYRITFLRMASDIFAAHPWAGIGDFSRATAPPVGLYRYASADAIAYGFTSGFHNQVVSNAVRSGVWGIAATLALLLIPLMICARTVRRGVTLERTDAMMGLAYCICVVVSSLTTEVVDLKFAASFYAVMTAVFCGAALGRGGEAAAAPRP